MLIWGFTRKFLSVCNYRTHGCFLVWMDRGQKNTTQVEVFLTFHTLFLLRFFKDSGENCFLISFLFWNTRQSMRLIWDGHPEKSKKSSSDDCFLCTLFQKIYVLFKGELFERRVVHPRRGCKCSKPQAHFSAIFLNEKVLMKTAFEIFRLLF